MNTIPEMQAKLDALQQKPAVRILAMESSCDETAAAIIENGRNIVSSVIFSQADTHALYGGVVPEIASRAHVDACDPGGGPGAAGGGHGAFRRGRAGRDLRPRAGGRAAHRRELHEGAELHQPHRRWCRSTISRAMSAPIS